MKLENILHLFSNYLQFNILPRAAKYLLFNLLKFKLKKIHWAEWFKKQNCEQFQQKIR